MHFPRARRLRELHQALGLRLVLADPEVHARHSVWSRRQRLLWRVLAHQCQPLHQYVRVALTYIGYVDRSNSRLNRVHCAMVASSDCEGIKGCVSCSSYPDCKYCADYGGSCSGVRSEPLV